MSEALKARVKAVNTANAYAIELYPKLRSALEPFVGKQVVKADGDLMAKVEKALPELPSDNRLHVYKTIYGYSLSWTVKVREPVVGREIWAYHEATLYMADLRGGVLTALAGPPTGFRTDYTVEEIVEKRKVYEEARKVADEARSALWPFGETDR